MDPEGCSRLQTPPSDVARSIKRHVLETGWVYEIDWIYCMYCSDQTLIANDSNDL